MKKNLQKLLMIFFAIFVIAICYKVPVDAADLGFQMTSDPSKVTDMITVEWVPPTAPSDGTTIVSYNFSIIDMDTNIYLARDLTDLSYSIKKGYGYEGYWKLECNYTYRFDNSGNEYSLSTSDYIYVNTTPATIAKKNFAVTYINTKNRATFEAIKPENATGVQLAVYYGSKCISNKKSTIGYFYDVPISKSKVYKYYVRAYYTNTTNKKTYCGKWSAVRQLANPSVSGSAKSSKAGIKLTVAKTSGVTKYKIYVSTDQKSGYKLSKTINVGSKSKYTVQLTKNVKKKKTNYIKLVPEIKGYGNSDIYFIGSIYVYK